MWKIALAFVVFAGLALFLLSKGGDIDMGGEKHGIDAPASADHAPAPAKEAAPVAAPAAAQVAAPAPAASQ